MARPPAEPFGKRRLPPLEPSPPPKRSGRVALLVMGTLAVGGGAYALMPHDDCESKRPSVAASAMPGQAATTCNSGSSSGGHGSGWSSRSGFYGGDSSPSHSSSSSETGGGPITRGGFGGFAHAIASHFSGG
ncbi:MAG: hypothetical protein ACTHK9_02545 [Nitrobacter sp.]|jgi:hypothetical protein